MSVRRVYDCESCCKQHSVINGRDPKTHQMREMVVDCPVNYAPNPGRFMTIDDGMPHIPSRINSKE